MLWVLAATVIILFFHRAVEGAVCSEGITWRRKYVWDMSTAAVLMVMVCVAWIFVAGEGSLWSDYGGILALSTPVTVAGIGFFAWLSRLEYDRSRNDEETG